MEYRHFEFKHSNIFNGKAEFTIQPILRRRDFDRPIGSIRYSPEDAQYCCIFWNAERMGVTKYELMELTNFLNDLNNQLEQDDVSTNLEMGS